MDEGALSTGALIALVAVGGLVLFGMGLYVSDYGIEAVVVDKDCPNVTVETKIGGIQVTRQATQTQCAGVTIGSEVVYHIRSGEVEYRPKAGGIF
ncbi:MAG: hypothetical protein R3185_09010 [Candidatus Thermoplasmatota archaeon]|nr:hypothetical protein [Candidatus Thermoplasmatota archaeon]